MTLLDAAPEGRATSAPRTYEVRTFGCQMNVHDSERLSGSLEAAGYVRATDGEADIVVINTCAVRENADNKLYGTLGHLAAAKRTHEGMQIAVGGCLAQKDKNVILEKAPWVDVVFGTHNMGSLPTLLERARHNGEAQLEILESLEVFPSTLPTRRENTYSGWVSISVGCNNTCTFCIVPSLRGKEKDRRPGDILAEIQTLVDDGAIEVTLLGQNVNSYGVEFGDRQAFSKLLRAAGEIEGLERVRFTSPHPAAFTDDVIDAMAETPNVMPQLHMPLQSGSDRILRAMRRSYRSERFLGILDRVRARIPHAAISTDIIVGFPGETEEDFAETLRVVEQARFASAFTFQYSIRPGTPAATMPDQLPKEVVQERYDRLIELQERISGEEAQKLVGTPVEVLVANGEGRRDDETRRMSGRAEDNRLVHFDVPEGGPVPRPGDVVSVTVTRATPHYLIAAPVGPELPIRRTRAGDAWDRAEAESCAVPAHGTTGGGRTVNLGLPGLRPRVSPLVGVVGATGTGKSDLALDLAERLAASGTPAEIVNADAMQLYRGMDIGTAKVPESERRGIPHHLLDVLEPRDEASVARYQVEARAVVDEVLARGAVPILVGGSGLYVSSVVYDFRFPGTDPAIRARLEAELDAQGPGMLHARLRELDPEAADAIGPHNGRRIVRALEVIELTGERFGSGLPEEGGTWRPTVLLGLRLEREALVPRLDARVERMWEAGLVDEVARLRPGGLGTTASRAIGYAQALAQLDGRLDEADAIAETQALTRRYARRQVSWFGRSRETLWLHADDPARVDAAYDAVHAAADRLPG